MKKYLFISLLFIFFILNVSSAFAAENIVTGNVQEGEGNYINFINTETEEAISQPIDATGNYSVLVPDGSYIISTLSVQGDQRISKEKYMEITSDSIINIEESNLQDKSLTSYLHNKYILIGVLIFGMIIILGLIFIAWRKK